MVEPNVYTEPEFVRVCKCLIDASIDFSVVVEDIRKHPNYKPRDFTLYFTPVLLGYKSEIRKFFFDKYGANHPVFEELTYDFINLETLEVLPTLLTEMRSGEFPRLAFTGIQENPVLMDEIFPNLKSLDLDYHSLQYWPECIGRATSLEELRMWGNSTRTVAENIGNLRKLKSLILAGNGLSKLPESISSISGLNELVISANNFEQLPDWISKLSQLIVLKVSNNSLNKIPEFIFSMENLETLDWSGNQLNEFPENIGKRSQIKELDLSRNNLSTVPDSMVNLEKLQILNLEENPISEEQIVRLRQKLPNCTVQF